MQLLINKIPRNAHPKPNKKPIKKLVIERSAIPIIFNIIPYIKIFLFMIFNNPEPFSVTQCIFDAAIISPNKRQYPINKTIAEFSH
jgi:hypothetical protein